MAPDELSTCSSAGDTFSRNAGSTARTRRSSTETVPHPNENVYRRALMPRSDLICSNGGERFERPLRPLPPHTQSPTWALPADHSRIGVLHPLLNLVE